MRTPAADVEAHVGQAEVRDARVPIVVDVTELVPLQTLAELVMVTIEDRDEQSLANLRIELVSDDGLQIVKELLVQNLARHIAGARFLLPRPRDHGPVLGHALEMRDGIWKEPISSKGSAGELAARRDDPQ